MAKIGGSLYQDHTFARLPSLAFNGVTLRIQYLVVVGEGARGTSEKQPPLHTGASIDSRFTNAKV